LARGPLDVVAEIENERDPEDGTDDAAELCHIASVRLCEDAFKWPVP